MNFNNSKEYWFETDRYHDVCRVGSQNTALLTFLGAERTKLYFLQATKRSFD